MKTPREHLDTLRCLAAAATHGKDVQRAIRFVTHDTPPHVSQLDAWNALLRALAAKNVPKLLSAFFFAKPFRAWMATDELGSRACAALLRAKFTHYDLKVPFGARADERRTIKQLLVRSGQGMPELCDVVLEVSRSHGMKIADELYVFFGMKPPERTSAAHVGGRTRSRRQG